MPQLNFSPLGGEGPQNFLQGYTQGQEIRNRLAAQEQQRQLADIQLQNALREQRMAGEEEAAYKSAGGDINRLQSELMQRGLGKQSLAVGAQLSKQRADQLAQQKTIVELSRDTAKRAMANPENAAQIYANFGRQLGVDVSDDLAEIQKFGGNPEAIRQWAAGHALEADKLLPKFETRDLGGMVQRQGYNPLTGAAIGAPMTYQKTMEPGAAARLAFDQQKFAWEKANPGYEIKDTDTGYVAVNKRNPADVRPVTMGAVPGAALGGASETVPGAVPGQVQSSKGLTEAQAKAVGFASRAKEADAILNTVKASPTAVALKQGLESTIGIGGVLGAGANVALSPAAQQVDQAQRNFVNAVLRQESGAAISQSEFENARKQYFAQPGDSQKVIEQKAKNRATVIRSLEAVAGPGMRKAAGAGPAADPLGIR